MTIFVTDNQEWHWTSIVILAMFEKMIVQWYQKCYFQESNMQIQKTQIQNRNTYKNTNTKIQIQIQNTHI